MFQPCGTNVTLWSYACQAIRRDSDRPPTLVQSGWMMSTARRSIHGMKLWRRVSTSPVEIGTGACSVSLTNPSMSSGGNASSNQTTSNSASIFAVSSAHL